jgi:hypothetical protein
MLTKYSSSLLNSSSLLVRAVYPASSVLMNGSVCRRFSDIAPVVQADEYSND